MRRVQLAAIGAFLVAGGCSGADTPTFAPERPSLGTGMVLGSTGDSTLPDTVVVVLPGIDAAATLTERGTGYLGSGY
jgi:hypothetical protein